MLVHFHQFGGAHQLEAGIIAPATRWKRISVNAYDLMALRVLGFVNDLVKPGYFYPVARFKILSNRRCHETTLLVSVNWWKSI
jgi:hypothetical protein